MSALLESQDVSYIAAEIDAKVNRFYEPRGVSNVPCVPFLHSTEGLVAQIIGNRILALSQKPLFLWELSELNFTSNLLTATCGVPLLEEISGMNESAKRWMKTFQYCLRDTFQHDHQCEISLWLLTLFWPADTLMSEGLKTLLWRYRGPGETEFESPSQAKKPRDRSLCLFRIPSQLPGKAKKQRDRSLCRFRILLASLDLQYSEAFHAKLKASGEFSHYCCSHCFEWRIRRVMAKLAGYQWQQQYQPGAPLRFR